MKFLNTFRLNINAEKLDTVWITSDTHYGHKNICRGTSKWTDLNTTRPFESIESMNDHIVDSINALVEEDHILIHLGDFAWKELAEEFRSRIKCKNVHLILGNHDNGIRFSSDLQDLFTSVSEYGEVKIFQKSNEWFKTVCLFHYPIKSWNTKHYGGYHFHGHIHSNHRDKYTDANSMDIGIDGNPGYLPYRLDHVIELVEKKNSIVMKHKDLFSIILGMSGISLYLLFFNFLLGGGIVDAVGGIWGIVLTIAGMGTALGALIKSNFLD